MPRAKLLVAAAVAALTLLGYFYFPGHTFLQSDTQIYIPILERLRDATLYQNDMIATVPHVAWTLYDETALGLRRLTGLDFESVLTVEQLVFRALGIWGVYLLANALGLPLAGALLVASVYSLGATITGPAVLAFEYEPVPRGFAASLLMLALGLVAQRRWMWAGVAASVAFLYHAPAGYPFWLAYFVALFWKKGASSRRERWMALLPLAAAAALLALLAALQPGITERQAFFSRIDAAQEQLQRMRASYNWVSVWGARWMPSYCMLVLVSMLALWRLWRSTSIELRAFLIGIPLIGLASVPASFVLLERWKWALMPQMQPARALMFVTVLAGVLATAAAVKAVRERRFLEGMLFLSLAYAIPAELIGPRGRTAETAALSVYELFFPDWSSPVMQMRVCVVLALAALAALGVWLEARRPRWAIMPFVVAFAAPVFAIPEYGKIRNYPDLESPELEQLAHWARTNTTKDAVFLFPDEDRRLPPGIFRANALRALYVDWKAGGQVNYFKRYGEEWWRRWQATLARKFDPSDVPRLAALGIDYLVFDAGHILPGVEVRYANPKFRVYAIR